MAATSAAAAAAAPAAPETPNLVEPTELNKYFRGGPTFPIMYNAQKGTFQVTMPHALGRAGQLMACGANIETINQKVQEDITTLRAQNAEVIRTAEVARTAAQQAATTRQQASAAAAQGRTTLGAIGSFFRRGRGGSRKNRKASRKNRKASRKNRKY